MNGFKLASLIRVWLAVAASLSALTVRTTLAADEPPKVNEQAPDFELKNLQGDAVSFSKYHAESPVVLVVLRGYPGYQCPACQQQVGQFVTQAKAIRTAGAKVLLIYPGPSADLRKRALEFVEDTQLPEGFEMVTDPDYTFTDRYHLRWDAAGETAYPSTFVVDRTGKIRFAEISRTHGGRVSPAKVLAALKSLR